MLQLGLIGSISSVDAGIQKLSYLGELKTTKDTTLIISVIKMS